MGVVLGVVGGLTAAGLGAYGASQSAGAAKDAAAATKSNTKRTNEANLLLNLFSRGAPLTSFPKAGIQIPAGLEGTSSAILPLYLSSSEADASQRAADIYKVLASIDPQKAYEDYQAIMARYQPQFAATEKLGSDIFNNNLTNELLSYEAPVAASRLEGVQTRKNAALEALQQTLNEIDSIQSRKGYTGDSLGSNLLKFNARARIASGSAQDLANAKLQNAQDEQAIKTSGVNLKLGNINLPDQLLQSAFARTDLPAQTLSKSYQTSLTPFSMFNLGPGQPANFSQMPAVTAVPTNAGIAATTASSALGALSNLAYTNALNNQALSNANQNYFSTNYGSGNMPSNYSSLSPSQQATYNYMYGNAQSQLGNTALYPQGASTYQ